MNAKLPGEPQKADRLEALLQSLPDEKLPYALSFAAYMEQNGIERSAIASTIETWKHTPIAALGPLIQSHAQRGSKLGKLAASWFGQIAENAGSN